MGNLYNLVVTYTFDFHGLADKPSDNFKPEVPTRAQLEVSCMEYFSNLLLELQNNLDYTDSAKERDDTKCISLSVFPE